MTYRKPARIAARRTPRILVTGLVLVTAITAALGYRLLTPASSTAASPIDAPRSKPARAQQAPRQALDEAASSIDAPRSEQPRPQLPPLQAAVEVAPPIDIPRDRLQGGAPGEADGVVPAGTTVFDDETTGVANLDPALLAALRQAATDAAGDGVAFFVNSGWRSVERPEALERGCPPMYADSTAPPSER